ncbi:type II secretion system protein [Fervidobacterium gondwanense]|nr:type II secretion system protein [Fervidobacterium gondwanense]
MRYMLTKPFVSLKFRLGFTIVELLIAIMIISLLMTVALTLIPSTKIYENTRTSKIAQQFKNLEKAVQNHVNFEKPDSLTSLSIYLLEEKEYISAVPKTFFVSGTNFVNGVSSVFIDYAGNDVPIEKLREYGLSEATTVGNNIRVELRIHKSW